MTLQEKVNIQSAIGKSAKREALQRKVDALKAAHDLEKQSQDRHTREVAVFNPSRTMAMVRSLYELGKYDGAYADCRRVMLESEGTAESREAAKLITAMFPPWNVVRVIDGDTIAVRRGNKSATVRLIGIDTPETVHPSKPVERFGKEASDHLKKLLGNTKVYLVSDTVGDFRDRYGRLIAYVYRLPDHLDVNREIVASGYGHAYVKYPFARMEEFRDVEREARETKIGLWSDTEQ